MLDTLTAACAAIFYLVNGVDNYVGEDGHNPEIAKLLEEYTRLVRSKPSSEAEL